MSALTLSIIETIICGLLFVICIGCLIRDSRKPIPIGTISILSSVLFIISLTCLLYTERPEKKYENLGIRYYGKCPPSPGYLDSNNTLPQQ